MERTFIQCKKCGKNLIERLPNGLLRFMFGRSSSRKDAVVEMIIHGNVKMQCLKHSCSEWNIINFFPFKDDNAVQSAKPKFSDEGSTNEIEKEVM